MKNYRVAVQVIRVYELDIPAESEDAAIAAVYGLTSGEIEDQGKHTDTTTDYAEVLDEVDDDDSSDVVEGQ